jgi:methionyl-tRNA synthetase
MGKDNIVFHSEIWPAMLFGYSGIGARGGKPGSLGAIDRPYEVVSSEFLTMEGKQFSSSRGVVIGLRDVLSRYDVDALRYYLSVAGPETQDTDFTWVEFRRRNNDELADSWGNLVNRSISLAARNFGAIPAAGALTDADARLLATAKDAFGAVGGLIERSRQKAAIAEAMRVVGDANRYLSDQAPWQLAKTGVAEDKARMGTILHVALQVVDDAKTLLTPFLPASSDAVHRLLGAGEAPGEWAPMPRVVEVDEPTAIGSPSYPVITGDYTGGGRWESTPLPVGRPLVPPKPLFKKLDPSIVDDELARLTT